MKRVLFQISSFLMALVVLFSTFSFTVAQHYCGDDLVDFSFFGQAESCGMEIQRPSDSHKHNLEKKDCCDDVTLSISGQHDLKLSFEKLSFEQQQFVVSFVYSYLNLFEGLQENIVPFNHYPPPLLVKDIQILDQTFLI
ncbi:MULTISPECIES: hypothetical protein [Arenibacter]|uniref:Secreted protein n=1 Tax=Arenibacter echinorum TaxID=440515 RepID=A0A327R2K2_9FLAO|nr:MULTISPECIES: hypothetical protein [Arenibacter]MCK0191949.1 hypothetical protein [Arenibacter sp. F20364]RAJ10288.1 hypothetical protein LV92_03037 [Arenibacter echinorum]